MSIWDDIKRAFEDLGDYFKQGLEYVVYGVNTAAHAISNVAVDAWMKTSALAEEMGNSFKEMGLVISQGVVDGVNMGEKYLNQAKDAWDEYVHPTPLEKKATRRAVSSMFMKFSQNGEEYDLYRMLSIACDEKKYDASRAAAFIVAERIADELCSVPLVYEKFSRKWLGDYLWFIIAKAATTNPDSMGGGKAGQTIAGLVTAVVTELLCENKIASDYNSAFSIHIWDTLPDPDAPTIWPEGARLRINEHIYLVLDGKVRHVPDIETFNNLFGNWDGIIHSIDGLQVGKEALTSGAYLATTHGDDKVYLVCDGVKRWIRTQQVFNLYHFNYGAVRKVSGNELNAIPTGKTMYQISRKEGSVLRMGAGADLYLLLDKKAHHIPNENTFNQLFANWNRIQEIDASMVPIGKPLVNGAHLASADGKAYFINGTEKRWIMNPLAFNSYNFDWNKIRKVTVEDLRSLIDGMPIY